MAMTSHTPVPTAPRVTEIVTALESSPHATAACVTRLARFAEHNRELFFSRVAPSVLKAIEQQLSKCRDHSPRDPTALRATQLLKGLVTASQNEHCALPKLRYARAVAQLVRVRGADSLVDIEHWQADQWFKLSKRSVGIDIKATAAIVAELRGLGLDRILRREADAPGISGQTLIDCVARHYGTTSAVLASGEARTTKGGGVFLGTFNETEGKVRIHDLPWEAATWSSYPIVVATTLLHETRHGIQYAMSRGSRASTADVLLLRLSLSCEQALYRGVARQVIDPDVATVLYKGLLSERDARAFAEEIVTALVDKQAVAEAFSHFDFELRRGLGLTGIALPPIAPIEGFPSPEWARPDSDSTVGWRADEAEATAPTTATATGRPIVLEGSLQSLAMALGALETGQPIASTIEAIRTRMRQPFCGSFGVRRVLTTVNEMLARSGEGRFSGPDRRLLSSLHAAAKRLSDQQDRNDIQTLRLKKQEVATEAKSVLDGRDDLTLRGAASFGSTIRELGLTLRIHCAAEQGSPLEVARVVRMLQLKADDGLLGKVHRRRFLREAKETRAALAQWSEAAPRDLSHRALGAFDALHQQVRSQR